MSPRTVLLAFTVSCHGVETDPEKIRATVKWSQSFRELATHYRCSVRNFSTIMAPITDCVKSIVYLTKMHH